MHENVRLLMSRMPPHEGAGDRIDWDQVRQVWGTGFPSDFMDFMSIYGTGAISDVLEISRQNEGAPGDGPFDAWFTPMEDWLGEVSAPYPEWPNPGSLISWGLDENQNGYYWSTRGDRPDRWPVVLWEFNSEDPDGFIEFDYGMAGVLLKAFGEDKPRPFDEGFIADITRPRFLHRREQARLRALGLDPWLDEG
ncbi:SMI1/KNR4 family protein [Streptomyces sp. NBC_01136]|uniref:hypothetical protein n=1 Tax=unclassified Streptomyces TaxID=2593676 RepID=UPI00325085C7|nr:SMI1/KNR4 family protein [Streptomyces sp. NBC_01136]